jgi:hypothetical protein
MEKKRGKNMGNKDLFRIASKLAMILLLPLALSLTCMILAYMIHGRLYFSLEPPIAAIICGVFISIIIAYGYITREKITSTLSGVFLFPLFTIYSGILCALADHYFTIDWLIGWLRWQLIPPSYAPFMLINGLAGYFASGGTKVSLLIAILFAILLIFWISCMGH